MKKNTVYSVVELKLRSLVAPVTSCSCVVGGPYKTCVMELDSEIDKDAILFQRTEKIQNSTGIEVQTLHFVVMCKFVKMLRFNLRLRTWTVQETAQCVLWLADLQSVKREQHRFKIEQDRTLPTNDSILHWNKQHGGKSRVMECALIRVLMGEEIFSRNFGQCMGSVSTQHRDDRNPVAKASYNVWGYHRANNTIPPF
ncbi:hypothetical protein ANN_04335 [Periplaneta americana]|uniref:Uncharacterized protein n=1 Tax=Periplaneta americana TaxID=6978 RepID=A0ABQ8T9U6_PERAM|nr:hypothetical protein ANN_04335 [Periplaneta americana]